jgi:hypothetical protein
VPGFVAAGLNLNPNNGRRTGLISEPHVSRDRIPSALQAPQRELAGLIALSVPPRLLPPPFLKAVWFGPTPYGWAIWGIENERQRRDTEVSREDIGQSAI